MPLFSHHKLCLICERLVKSVIALMQEKLECNKKKQDFKCSSSISVSSQCSSNISVSSQCSSNISVSSQCSMLLLV